jgi:RecA-family ATPase
MTEGVHPFTRETWRTVDPPPAGPRAEPPEAFPIIDPTTLAGKPIKPRRWIVEDWVPVGHVTLIYGDGGLGKSLIAQQLMTAAATGKGWLGLPVTPCRSLAMFCEDDADELHRRQDRINDHYGIYFEDLADVRWWPRVGGENAIWSEAGAETPLFDQIRAQAREFGARLVIVDTAADAFGADDNDKTLVRGFLQRLQGLARDIDGAVVVLAHPSVTSMSTGRGTHGHVQWNNAVRSRLYLTKPDVDEGEDRDAASDRRVLAKMKANYGKAGEEILLAWSEGVFAPEGQPYTDTVDRIERSGRERETQEAFLAALDERNRQLRPLSHSRQSGNYGPREVGKMNPKFRVRELEAAMEALLSAGTIIANTQIGRGANRHPVYGLARTEARNG